MLYERWIERQVTGGFGPGFALFDGFLGLRGWVGRVRCFVGFVVRRGSMASAWIVMSSAGFDISIDSNTQAAAQEDYLGSIRGCTC